MIITVRFIGDPTGYRVNTTLKPPLQGWNMAEIGITGHMRWINCDLAYYQGEEAKRSSVSLKRPPAEGRDVW